jgi:hypothetical protein
MKSFLKNPVSDLQLVNYININRGAIEELPLDASIDIFTIVTEAELPKLYSLDRPRRQFHREAKRFLNRTLRSNKYRESAPDQRNRGEFLHQLPLDSRTFPRGQQLKPVVPVQLSFDRKQSRLAVAWQELGFLPLYWAIVVSWE